MSSSNEFSEAVLFVSSDSDSSPTDQLSHSFSSIATSVGPLQSPTYPSPLKCSGNFVVSSEDEDYCSVCEEEEEEGAGAWVVQGCGAPPPTLSGPSQARLTQDRQRIAAVNQNRLNDFILKHTKQAVVNRQDHHIMLRQLIGEAYFHDPVRAAHRPQWRKIMVAIRKEYWGANAIFSLTPDPYHSVLATLSSMTIWNDEVRTWEYKYNDMEFNNRRGRQAQVLEQLRREGVLFL